MPKRKVVQKSITSFYGADKGQEKGSDESKPERRAKQPRIESKVKNEAEKKPMNKTETNYEAIDFECSKKNGENKDWNFKISSWNIVSLKALTKKNGMEFLKHEDPDVICFQETKCSEKNCPQEAKISNYNRYFVSGVKEGYAGVALYSKQKPLKVTYGLGVEEHDSEGRLITAEFEKFYLVTTYVPNAGSNLKTLPKRLSWDTVFKEYLNNLDKVKPVILCGDLNVAHHAIDLKNPDTNVKSAGFTQEERDGFTALLSDGYVDTFRHLYPNLEGSYTYWDYRTNARNRNIGWRLDYFVVSNRLLPAVCDNVIRSQVYGSDHCPITLFLNV